MTTAQQLIEAGYARSPLIFAKSVWYFWHRRRRSTFDGYDVIDAWVERNDS